MDAKALHHHKKDRSRHDHIFVTGELQALNNLVVRSRIATVASDHLPLVSDLELNETQAKPTPTAKNIRRWYEAIP